MTEEKKEIKKEKNLIVSVKYNMHAPWVINKGLEGKLRLYQGDIIDLNLHNKKDLKSFIEIMKQINYPKVNINSYYDKQDKAQPYKYRKRFELVGGEENIPEHLKKITFKDVNRFNKEEIETIKNLVPDFFKENKNIGKIRR